MRNILYTLTFIVASLLGNMTYANEPVSACTMQYAPVCWSIEVQCIRAPCYPVRQTFGNQCMANMAKASNITVGECGNIPPVVWWDIDSHGCFASAGYTWESRAKKCLRPWESHVRIIFISPDKKTCTGISSAECLQIRLPSDKFWTNLYSNIVGFDHIQWYMYRLLILETNIENPPADSPSMVYSLIRVLSKSAVMIHEDAPFIGDWKLTSFNTTDVSNNNFTATFTKNRFSIKLCNNINGEYSLNGNIFIAPNSVSTMMYCDWLPMTLENAWNLNGATYSLVAIRRMAGSVGPTMQVTITMKNGNSFTFSN